MWSKKAQASSEACQKIPKVNYKLLKSKLLQRYTANLTNQPCPYATHLLSAIWCFVCAAAKSLCKSCLTFVLVKRIRCPQKHDLSCNYSWEHPGPWKYSILLDRTAYIDLPTNIHKQSWCMNHISTIQACSSMVMWPHERELHKQKAKAGLNLGILALHVIESEQGIIRRAQNLQKLSLSPASRCFAISISSARSRWRSWLLHRLAHSWIPWQIAKPCHTV